MRGKKIALISSYCDTPEKISTLKDNCEILKKLDIDTFVISPLYIEVDSDFLFITKENPILKWPERMYSLWREIEFFGKTLRIQTHIDDYGWASLYQIKKILEISKNLDYDFYYLLIYDLDITPKIINEIEENKINISYPRIDKNSDFIYKYSFHFSIFDKDNVGKIGEKISLNEYLSSNGFAESFISSWMEDLKISSSDIKVSDKIFLHENKDYFNYSKSDLYKAYLGKNLDETNIFANNREGVLDDSLRIFLYDIKGKVRIVINNEIVEESFGEKYLLEKKIKCSDVFRLEIMDQNQIIDYSEIYQNITKNLIYFT